MDALIIGGGPAGIMAADTLSALGHKTMLVDAMPTLGRKFLMAGKSGLNITMDEDAEAFKLNFFEAIPKLKPILDDFDNQAAIKWATDLGQEVFTGSSGRIFPKTMKASPLLRAWLNKLDSQGVETKSRWRWIGFGQDDAQIFDTPEGRLEVKARVVIFALGGASWKRLGSNGSWVEPFREAGISVKDFTPMNMGIRVNWSKFMKPFFGTPLKPLGLVLPNSMHRGECILTETGLEGSGIYTVSRGMRKGHPLRLDLVPDLPISEVGMRLSRQPAKASAKTKLRKALQLSDVKIALLNEFLRPWPDYYDLAKAIKALPIPYDGIADIDKAISTGGGVSWDDLSDDLSLKSHSNIFCAGEMLDWEAPTGGYLITACLASGQWAAKSAAQDLD